MKESFLSVEELSDILGVNPSNLRTYLGGYRFAKFISKTIVDGRYKTSVKFTKQCAYRLCDFFGKIKRNDIVENIEKYFEERDNGSK